MISRLARYHEWKVGNCLSHTRQLIRANHNVYRYVHNPIGQNAWTHVSVPVVGYLSLIRTSSTNGDRAAEAAVPMPDKADSGVPVHVVLESINTFC